MTINCNKEFFWREREKKRTSGAIELYSSFFSFDTLEAYKNWLNPF